MGWYRTVTNDLSKLPSFIDYHDQQLTELRKDVAIRGSLEHNSARLPGLVEEVFRQLQEIEAVLKYIEIQNDVLTKKYFQKFLEGYNKQLSSRDAEKYANAEKEVVDNAIIRNEVALIRNQYLGLSKAYEAKGWQIGNITKLRCAGLDDSFIQD
jgi:hypothetical protein